MERATAYEYPTSWVSDMTMSTIDEVSQALKGKWKARLTSTSGYGHCSLPWCAGDLVGTVHNWTIVVWPGDHAHLSALDDCAVRGGQHGSEGDVAC